jgi:hypothetical protein
MHSVLIRRSLVPSTGATRHYLYTKLVAPTRLQLLCLPIAVKKRKTLGRLDS